MAETLAQKIARERRQREALEAQERAYLTAGAQRRGPPLSDPIYAQRPGGGLTGALREGVLQGDTALSSAANTVSFGWADPAEAGVDALFQAGGLNALKQRYQAKLAQEQARNQYDASHRRLAQNIGQGGAIALSLLGGKAAIAPRIGGAARLSAREGAAILGAGGLTGLGMQDVTDAATHRNTDWQDGLGAMAGGVIGAAALPLGTGRAAAVGSAATTAAQSWLHGRPVSLEDLGRSAVAGRAVGSLAGMAGRAVSRSLPVRAKGQLGETLGDIRSSVNQLPREPGPKKMVRVGNARTYPDGISGDFLFEDKFGPTAKLSWNQKIAQRVLGSKYVVYHFLPEDVGKIVSAPAGTAAPQVSRRRPALY